MCAHFVRSTRRQTHMHTRTCPHTSSECDLNAVTVAAGEGRVRKSFLPMTDWFAVERSWKFLSLGENIHEAKEVENKRLKYSSLLGTEEAHRIYKWLNFSTTYVGAVFPSCQPCIKEMFAIISDIFCLFFSSQISKRIRLSPWASPYNVPALLTFHTV